MIHMQNTINIWRPPSLSELTPMISNKGLTHLGSEASKQIGHLLVCEKFGKLKYMQFRYFSYACAVVS